MCLCEILFHITENVFRVFLNVRKEFGDEAMNRTQTHEWYKHFKEGQTSIKDKECSELPSIKKLRKNSKRSQSDSF